MNLLVIIFALITILSAVAAFNSIKEKNILALVLGLASAGIIGWFTIMTVIFQGYPPNTLIKE